jgi:hypothetical protein
MLDCDNLIDSKQWKAAIFRVWSLTRSSNVFVDHWNSKVFFSRILQFLWCSKKTIPLEIKVREFYKGTVGS